MITADTITDEQIRELRTIARGAATYDGTVYLDGNHTIFSGEVIDLCQVALGIHMQTFALTRREARARCAEILNARAKEQKP